MAKATDVSREKTELCHFRHSDLVNRISANLFTCVVMIFEDNFVSIYLGKTYLNTQPYCFCSISK